eukprot:8587120-Alexandrium_andersonii.AAC.1
MVRCITVLFWQLCSGLTTLMVQCVNVSRPSALLLHVVCKWYQPATPTTSESGAVLPKTAGRAHP